MVGDVDLPMLIGKSSFSGLHPIPLKLNLSSLSESAEGLQPLIHLIIQHPPALECRITCIYPLVSDIPVAIVVSAIENKQIEMPWYS